MMTIDSMPSSIEADVETSKRSMTTLQPPSPSPSESASFAELLLLRKIHMLFISALDLSSTE